MVSVQPWVNKSKMPRTYFTYYTLILLRKFVTQPCFSSTFFALHDTRPRNSFISTLRKNFDTSDKFDNPLGSVNLLFAVFLQDLFKYSLKQGLSCVIILCMQFINFSAFKVFINSFSLSCLSMRSITSLSSSVRSFEQPICKCSSSLSNTVSIIVTLK